MNETKTHPDVAKPEPEAATPETVEAARPVTRERGLWSRI